MSFKRQRQVNIQRLNGLAEPVPVQAKQPPKEQHQMKYGVWPSEAGEVPTSHQVQADNSVKSLLQPMQQAAFMKNKKRNESSSWMLQQSTPIPQNMQQFNYGPAKVQSFVDDKIDYSAYEMGKKNFQKLMQADTNLPAGAYYDTPSFIDPATGQVMSYELPSANASVEPSQQIKILEVNMGQKMPCEAQKAMPIRQQCNNPNCTGCRGK